MYATQYANGGLKFLNMIACQLIFKEYYKLEPTQTASYLAIIWIPWGVKLFYGVISDTFPIFKSRKKNWLILMGFIQTFCLIICSTIVFQDVNWFLFIQFMVSVSAAFMDVVADAVMVMQARRDPEQGSQEL